MLFQIFRHFGTKDWTGSRFYLTLLWYEVEAVVESICWITAPVFARQCHKGSQAYKALQLTLCSIKHFFFGAEEVTDFVGLIEDLRLFFPVERSFVLSLNHPFVFRRIVKGRRMWGCHSPFLVAISRRVHFLCYMKAIYTSPLSLQHLCSGSHPFPRIGSWQAVGPRFQ